MPNSVPKEAVPSIDINVSTRKRFAVDNDLNKIIELDINDVNLVSRLSDAIEKMDGIQKEWEALAQKAGNISDDEDNVNTEDITDFSSDYKSVEQKMRELVDYIFDSPGLCDIILENSSIFSPVNGKFKYDQIITALTKLYEKNIKSEADKINERKVYKKTSKYTKHK